MDHVFGRLLLAILTSGSCLAGCSPAATSVASQRPGPPEAAPGPAGSSVNAPSNSSTFRGIPDPSDLLGFDVWADYPADRTVTGDRGKDTLSCNGSAKAPCVIDASGASFTNLSLSGTFVVLDGGLVNAGSGRGDWFSSRGCSFCVIRDLEVAGPGTASGYSSAVGLGQGNVWIRGSIHGFGDNRQHADEQDFHGMKLFGPDQWVLNAEIYDVSGDSVQVGDASRGSAERVYIGGGYFHHNRENAVDIKDSRNVVVSGVRMEGFRPTQSSSGAAVVIHDDAFDAAILDNVILDTSLGIVSSGVSGHVIEGNDITAREVGIQLRHTRDITVTGNTIKAPVRVQVQGAVTGTVQD